MQQIIVPLVVIPIDGIDLRIIHLDCHTLAIGSYAPRLATSFGGRDYGAGELNIFDFILTLQEGLID